MPDSQLFRVWGSEIRSFMRFTEGRRQFLRVNLKDGGTLVIEAPAVKLLYAALPLHENRIANVVGGAIPEIPTPLGIA